MLQSLSDPNTNPNGTLPYTAKLPCLLRGDLHCFSRCEPSFYTVGKITKNGWRNAFDVPMPSDWEEYRGTSPVPTHYGFAYCGPFFVRCDHGCSHLSQSHATAGCGDGWKFQAEQVFRRSKEQIQQAGFVFLWAGIGEDALDTAYGSLVEFGIAHALRKPVLLVHHPQADLRPFWFAAEAVSAVICAEQPIAALEMLKRSQR